MIKPQPIEFLPKIFREPTTAIEDLTPDALAYLTETRKLTKDTLDAYRVGCTKKGNIAIPFYDEHDKRQLVKFRHPKGELIKWTDKEGLEHEAKTISEPQGKGVLLGSHLCHPSAGGLIICFGDYDAMSVYQAGVPNVVSLPFGDGGLDFIKYQWDWLETFPDITLFPDNDTHLPSEKREKSREKLLEMARRLGLHRCKIVTDRQNAKDANDLLIHHGEDACLAAIESADWIPEDGLVKVADHISEQFEEGHSTGIRELDQYTGGFSKSDLVVLSGDNGSGKTTLALNITAHFIDQRSPVFLWSGEQRVEKIRSWFERIVAGHGCLRQHTSENTGFTYYFPRDEFIEPIRNWYREYFFQYKKFHADKESFFAVVETAIRRYGVRLVIIDNLMAFTGGEGEGYYQAQGDFAQSCKMFAEKWNVTVILIAHNKKVKESATDFRLSTKDDIEGSKKITNWADTVLQMNRVPPQFREGIYLGADGVLGLCKSRESGIMGNIPIVVDLSSNRIAPTGQSLDQRAYGWDTRYD